MEKRDQLVYFVERDELEQPERLRKPGGGRKKAEDKDPTLMNDLEEWTFDCAKFGSSTKRLIYDSSRMFVRQRSIIRRSLPTLHPIGLLLSFLPETHDEALIAGAITTIDVFLCAEDGRKPHGQRPTAHARPPGPRGGGLQPVSYTHLTLPTIYSV